MWFVVVWASETCGDETFGELYTTGNVPCTGSVSIVWEMAIYDFRESPVGVQELYMYWWHVNNFTPGDEGNLLVIP